VKKAILILSFLGLWYAASGQEIEALMLKTKFKELNYARFLDHSAPEGILLSYCLEDSTSTADWLQQLYPVADKNGWLALVVPYKPADDKKHWQAVSALLRSERDSLESSVPVYLLVHQAPWIAEIPELEVPLNVGGFVLTSAERPEGRKAYQFVNNKPIALLGANHAADSLVDSIRWGGAWLRDYQTDEAVEGTPLMSLLPAIDEGLSWVDSLSSLLRDSSDAGSMNAKAGITNRLPEVVKKGRPISIDVFVPSPADCRFELLDLSGEAAWSTSAFLGRGNVQYSIPTKSLNWGVYQLEVEVGSYINRHKIIIRG